MRDSVVRELSSLMEYNDKIIFVTADLGFGLFDEIKTKFPKRFLNVGVAEQNMIGVSSGLAMVGFTIVAYSIGNFASLRCLEQIRNDAAYHKCPITIISSGAGFSYGQLGMSHHALEDAAIMNIIPNIKVATPSCPSSAVAILKDFINNNNNNNTVNYLRLDKSNNEFYNDINYKLSNINFIEHGDNVCIISQGSILVNVIVARQLILSTLSINAAIIDFPYLNKIYCDDLIKSLSAFKYIITVEEQSIIGGLGSMIANIISSTELNCKLLQIALPNEFISIVGEQSFLREKYGLCSNNLFNSICNFLKE